MSVKLAVVQGAAPTSATTQDFVAPLGFGTPKAAILMVSKGTVNGTVTDDMMIAVGFTDGSNSYTYAVQSEHNVGNTDADRIQDKSAALLTVDIAGAKSGEASFDSFSDRTLTIDWSGNPPPSAFLVTCILIGGTDVEANMATTNIVGTTNIAHGLSAAPNLMFFTSTTAAPDGRSDDVNGGIGVCTYDGTTITQRGVFIADDHGDSTTDVSHYFDAQVVASLQPGQVNRSFRVTDVDGTNVEMTRTGASFGSDPLCLFISIGSATNKIELVEYDAPTADGTQSITNTDSFEPQFILLGQSNAVGSGFTEGDSGLALGAIDANGEYSVAVGGEHNTSVTNTRSVTANKALHTIFTDLTDQVGLVGTILSGSGSIDSDGFTIDWTTTNSASSLRGFALMVEVDAGTSFDEVSAGADSIDHTGQVGILQTGFINSGSTTNYEWTGFAGSVQAGFENEGTTTTYEWTGFAGSVQLGFAGEGSTTNYEWTGYAGSEVRGFIGEGITKTYEWTGYTGSIQVGSSSGFNETSTSETTYEWTGYAGSEMRGVSDVGQTTVYEWTGFAGTVEAGFINQSNAATTYEWTGFAGSLLTGIAAEGSATIYEWTGFVGSTIRGQDVLQPVSEKIYEWTGFAGSLQVTPIQYFSVVDKRLAFLLRNGSSSPSHKIAEKEFLVSEGITDTGDIRSMWMLWLDANSATANSWPDRLVEYLVESGYITPSRQSQLDEWYGT